MQQTNLQVASLSKQQELYWRWLQTGQIEHTQGVQSMFLLEGRLELELFRRAIQDSLRRYEILRTTFAVMPGMEIPMQVLSEHGAISCPIMNLQHLDAVAQQEVIAQHWQGVAQRPFDLEHGPLIDMLLLRLGEENHVLIVRMCILCADVSTLRYFCEDILRFYSAFSHNDPLPDDDEVLQYIDVMSWQSDLFTAEGAEAQQHFWDMFDLSRLSSVRLPFQFSSAQENALAQPLEQYPIVLGAQEQERLREFCQRKEITPAAYLLTCWQVLLWRVTGDSPLIGLTCDGRPYEELETAPGPYTRTVPFTLALDAETRFEQALLETSQLLQELHEKQLYFDWERQAPDGSSQERHFPISFSAEVWPEPWQAATLQVYLYQQQTWSEPSALHLHVRQRGQAIALELSWQAQHFSEAQGQRLATLFSTLLRGALTHPQASLVSLPLLTQEQQAQQRERLRGKAADWPFVPLHQRFQQQAQRTPRTPALHAGELLLNYQQLDQLSNQLARVLIERGVRPGGRVVLYQRRDQWAIISLLAVLKAGGCYVPFDEDLPAERVRLLLDDLAPALLLCNQELQERIGERDLPTLLVERLPVLLWEQPTAALHVEVGPEDLAYVMYTSGSTGAPKGVEIRHSSVSNYISALSELLELHAGWHLGTVSSLAADLGNTSIFCGLSSGGCVHLLPYQLVTDGAAFARYVRQYPLDVLKIVPSHLHALLAGAGAMALPRERLIMGGEALPWSLVEQLHQMGGSCRLYNHYGPTEGTIGSLVQELGPLEQLRLPEGGERSSSVPIGRALAGVQVALFDEQGQPVPQGMVGEIYLGGAGLAAGYQGGQEMGEARFVQEQGQRWYRTGDLGREDEQGRLVFVGRQDSQVKLRGYRIELGEIEAQLLRQPTVREAVVQKRQEETGEEYLVGYIVPWKQPPPGQQEIREALLQQLPGYMVPTRIMALEQLPLTANGKLDRRRLPAPTQEEELVSYARPEEPRTPIEEVMLGVWRGVLGIQEIGRHEDFFRLGGHSLLGTRVIARLRSVFGVEVPITRLFESPTIAGLSRHIAQALRQGEGLEEPPIVPVSRAQPLPLSFAQQRLWFLNQLEPGSTTYNLPTAVRLRGPLNRVALGEALIAVMRRHESLRTTFPTHEGESLQQIHSQPLTRLLWQDLSILEPEQREQEALRLARQEAEQPFDLAHGPLLRAWLLVLDQEDQVVLLSMHHIISDGWSSGILVRELSSLYGALLREEEADLPALPIQYADYALWQRSWLQGEMLAQQVAYWQNQLSGLHPLDLPLDHPRPAVQTFHGAQQRLLLSRSLSEQLQDLSRREGVTLFMTLLATFQVLLARSCGQGDIAVGTPIANRTREEVEGLIGFFVNTLVLRSDLSDNPRFVDLLARVRRVALEAYAHQDIPFEQVVDAVQPQRDLSRSPLFQVIFVLQNVPEITTAAELSLVQAENFAVEQQTTKFDISLIVTDSEQGLHTTLEYNTDLFEPATIQRMLSHWHLLLEGVAQHPEMRIAALPLLTTIEREELVVEWNATQAQVHQDTCMHQLFEEQARHAPEAVALVFEGHHLTYAELDQRANQLARYLRTQGVGPERLVGLRVERSLEMLIGLMGILKAGGAYLPLDPVLPIERLRFLLADAGCALLLTQQHLRESLPDAHLAVVCLDSEWTALDSFSREPVNNQTGVENLAYVIYTSGSTGTPKGVQVTHKGIANLSYAQGKTFGVSPTSRVLQFASFSFDASVSEIAMALLSGAVLSLAPGDRLLPGSDLIQFLREQAITHVTLPPTALAVLPDEALPALQTLIVAGEAVSSELVTCWASDRRFFNAYGPTEDTVCASVAECFARQEKPGIGRPIANQQMYVLDRWLQPVPAGVAGELYLGGIGLARGYLKRADLTAERFIPDPFGQQKGTRLYKTGDLARLRNDGQIEFLGRIDQQVKIRGYRIELGEIEATLAAHPLIEEAAVLAREDTPGDKRLVAYVVLRPEQTLSTGDLRAFLQEQLPAYMLPSVFVWLDALPLTTSAKIDRRALPAPTGERLQEDVAFQAPQTAVEKVLAQCWEEVLRAQEIGLHDNFFERGGDSILAIQIVARARQQGVHITLKDLFQYQTIAQLSAVAQMETRIETPQGLVVGEAPLTPIQHWFFEMGVVAPHQWNQALFVQCTRRLRLSTLRQALAACISHHDALRLRFEPSEHEELAGWRAWFAEERTSASLSQVDLSALPVQEQETLIASIAEQAQTSLDLAQGPLLRAVSIERGAELPQLLLFACHHLVIDGVSWRILLEDLHLAYQQAEQGEVLRLPAKSSSWQQWGEHLLSYAASTALQEESTYWLSPERTQVSALPLDLPALPWPERANTVASSAVLYAELTAEETRALLEEVPASYHSQINEVLLTALASSLKRWLGTPKVLIDLEGHGREELFDDLDLSRTVGWFTSLFPLLLEVHETATLPQALQAIKRQMRALPQHGVGYGPLRYLHPDPQVREQLRARPQAQISFNYLGQLDQRAGLSSLFAGEAPFSAGPTRNEQGGRTHLLIINSQVSGGRLRVSWSYCQQVHQRPTMERLLNDFMEALRSIIAQAYTAEGGVAILSDFPLIDLNQEQLEQMLLEMDLGAGGSRNIESITALSPTQEGMLYETLLAPGSGMHIEQAMYTLTGPLDVSAMQRAWQWGVERHAILRTGFVWKDSSSPLQVALREAALPFALLDWRDLSPQQQQTQAEEYFRQERVRGFDLSQPPLMRVTLIRLGEERWRLLWVVHHILLDGWSRQVLLSEIITCYIALSRGQAIPSLEASHPYSDYIAWLQRQDIRVAETFWRDSLQGFTHPTALGQVQERQPGEEEPQPRSGVVQLHLPAGESAALQAVTRRQHVTLSTLLQGLWAVLLSRFSGERDVLFGVTVSGRPAELAGAEQIVGLCINTLPLRVRVPEQGVLWNWLSELQGYKIEMQPYEYVSAGQVHQWSELAGRSLLYESLLVVENYPVAAGTEQPEAVGMTMVDAVTQGAQTRYALTLLVVEGTRLGIRCVYDPQRFARASVELILGQLHQLLRTVALDAPEYVTSLEWVLARESLPVVYAVSEPVDTQRERTYQGPRGPLEELVASVWEEVLGLEHLSPEQNFFDLGGHSLLATQVIVRLRQVLGYEIPLRTLFEAPVLSDFATRLQEQQLQRSGREMPALVPVSHEQELPLSFAQQRLWFLQQFDPASTAYTVPAAVRLRGQVDRVALERALLTVIGRHENLRTLFPLRGGEPVQVISPEPLTHLLRLDLSTLAPEQREHEMQRLLQQEVQQPFDLAHGPLLRTWLLILDEREHLLLMSMHHIISDGWSSGVLVRELSSLYTALQRGEEAHLPPLPIQYADYALWQRNWLQGEVLEQQLGYWKRQLAGLSPLELPLDHPRPPLQTFQGARQRLRIPARLSQQLQELSRREGVTLFMTLLASFQILLSRWSGQDDIAVGTPIANRTRKEIEGLIGCFVNTLVLRSDLSGAPSFREVLRRVREMTLAAYSSQDLPFEQVVEAVQPRRDMSRSPLFQVLFVMQNTPEMEGGAELASVLAEGFAIEQRTAKFELSLIVVETAQGFNAILEYNTNLFAASTIEQMAEHWQQILEGAVANPDQEVARLPLQSSAKQAQLLEQWQIADPLSLSHPLSSIHQMFEAQVERTPHSVAVAFGEQQLTYAALNRCANQLAHHLRTLGVGPDVLVGICMERVPELIIGLLGILKAGGAYVPLDPAYPQERLAFMIADARLPVLLTQQHLRNILPRQQAQIVCLDTLWGQIAREATSNPVSAVTTEHIAYSIYTSGSTGRPKGVLISHANVARLLRATEPYFHFNERDVWTFFHSYAFDFSVWEIWGSLLYGGRLLVVSYLMSRTPETFYQLLLNEHVTVLNQTPSAFDQLMRAEQAVWAKGITTLALRLVIFGGEALEPRKLTPWFELHGDQMPRLINMYGITETTVHVTYRQLSQEERLSASNIGKPLSDLKIYILDRYQQLLPIGIPGEIYVGGAGQARGYLNRPDLTAERFIPDPWATVPGARLYRTGDQARYRLDGTLEYLGRIDHQVKVRGFRIELGEIEHALRQHPAVSECVVAVREDTPEEPRLVAYIVPVDAEDLPSASELRSALQLTLPDYMVPAVFHPLSALPVTPNGKLDWGALPAPDEQRLPSGTTYVAPTTPTERILAEIWEEVLGVEQISIHDNFFVVGGDSIRSIQILAEVRERGLSTTLQHLFQYQTIHELAQVVEVVQTTPPEQKKFQAFNLLSAEDRAKLQRSGR